MSNINCIMDQSLECAVPSKTTSHCMDNSKRLQCQHFICSDCSENHFDRKSFGCKHCGEKIDYKWEKRDSKTSFDLILKDMIQKSEQNLTELLGKHL